LNSSAVDNTFPCKGKVQLSPPEMTESTFKQRTQASNGLLYKVPYQEMPILITLLNTVEFSHTTKMFSKQPLTSLCI